MCIALPLLLTSSVLQFLSVECYQLIEKIVHTYCYYYHSYNGNFSSLNTSYCVVAIVEVLPEFSFPDNLFHCAICFHLLD
jgi:hypothetical protein